MPKGCPVAGAHAKPARAGRARRLSAPGAADTPGRRGAAAAHAAPGAAGPPPGSAVGHPTSKRLADVARGSTLNLAGAAFSGAATVAVTILVTRNFSKPVAGAFFTAISLFLIAETAASLGGYVGLVNFIAGLRALGRERRVPAILRAAIIPVVIASLATGTAMVLAAGPLARVVLSGHLGHSGASPAVVTGALRALGIALPFGAILDTLLGASRGYRDMRPSVFIDRLGRSALQLLGVSAAVAVGAASLLAPLWALPYLPAAGVAWLWFRRVRRRSTDSGPGVVEGAGTVRRPDRRRRNALASKRLARENARGFWRFTAPRALAALAQITIQRLDIVLVAILRGPAEAAIYTAATRFLVAGQFTNSAISLAAQPRFAELFAIGDRRGANVLYQATTAWLMLLTWPLYLLAMLYGSDVLTVFGHSYRAGGTVMVILGGTMLLATACGQVDMVLIATGRSSWSLANGLMAVGVNVALDLILIPAYGITGAAVGWAAAIAVTNLVPLAQLAFAARVHPFGQGTLAAAALPAICFGAIPLATRVTVGPGALPAAFAVGAGCALLAAGLWRFRLALRLSALAGLVSGRKARSRPRTAPPVARRQQPKLVSGEIPRSPDPGRVTLPRQRTPTDQE